MIIDAHTHIGSTLTKPSTAASLLKSMDEASIDTSIVIAIDYHTDPSMHVEQLLQECASPRLKVVGSLYYGAGVPAQTKRLIALMDEQKIVGVKLFPGYENFYPTDKALAPLYKYCAQHDIPVIFHTGLLARGEPGLLKQIQPLLIDEVANAYPKLKIIMAHFGNPWVTECGAVTYKNDNVFVDLSGFFEEFKPIAKNEADFFLEQVESFIDVAGNFNKVLFGTDYPLYSQKEYLSAVERLPMTSKEKELVLWKNATKIFHLS